MKSRLALFMGVLAIAIAGAGPSSEWSARGEKLEQNSPTPWRALGLLEIQRASGESVDINRALAALPKTGTGRDSALQSIAWRMLPVSAEKKKSFDSIVDALGQASPKDPWLATFRLYSASVADDRPGLIAAAKNVSDLPTSFPSAAAEKAHFELLKELGVDDNQAGLEVISHRSFAPLRGLLELDRALSRHVEFLDGTTRAGDAKILRDCRDRLRQAWLDDSTRMIERLFALHTLGRDQDCDALLFAARELPYLTDPSEMTRTLARLDQAQAWTLIIQPLLESEIRLIASPPKLPAKSAPVAGQLTIEAKNKTILNSLSTYEGSVRARAGTLDMTCDKLAVITDAQSSAKLLSGAGNVSIRGAAGGFELVQCENFTLSIDTGAFSLGGNVRLRKGDQTQKFRACTLGRTGEVRDAISLLDDFDNATGKEKLALLPRITVIYTDAELPADVKYILALSLLRPHLQWRAAAESDLPVEAFLREDAQQQLQSGGDGGKSTSVETILSKQIPVALTFTVKDSGHADIARARDLLGSIKTGSVAESARKWESRLR